MDLLAIYFLYNCVHTPVSVHVYNLQRLVLFPSSLHADIIVSILMYIYVNTCIKTDVLFHRINHLRFNVQNKINTILSICIVLRGRISFLCFLFQLKRINKFFIKTHLNSSGFFS